MLGLVGKPAHQTSLILRAGDVEKNPGPVRWPCGKCGLGVSNKDYSIRCGDCHQWVHRRCTGMSVPEIRSWQQWRWHCGCRPSPPPSVPAPPSPPVIPTPKQTPTPPVPTANGPKAKGPLELRIMQLNIAGWRGKATALNKLLDDLKIDAAVIQETKITAKDPSPNTNGWTTLRADRTIHRTPGEHPQGGLVTLVRPGIVVEQLPSLRLPDSAALESIGVKLHLQKGDLDIWNVYRPPVRGGSDDRDADLYLDRWPHSGKVLICGDLNAHGTWDSFVESDTLGEAVEVWQISSQMSHLNTGAPTRVDHSGNPSAPDVSLVHSSRSHLFSWSTLDTIGSDHLPILIEITNAALPGKKEKRRPNYRKTDWNQFKLECEKRFDERDNTGLSIEKEHAQFVETVLEAAARCTPLGGGKGPRKPWWSRACTEAKKAVSRDFRQLRNSPGDPEAVRRYTESKINMDRTVKDEKRRSWREFTGTLTPQTPTTKVWGMLRSMDGRQKNSLPDAPIKQGDTTAISDWEKAKLAAATYAKVSRVRIPRAQSKAAYLTVRAALRPARDPVTDELESDFTLAQLKIVLDNLSHGAPGTDTVHPLLLKHLPDCGQTRLLDLINRSWVEGRVPMAWRRAVIVPILKKKKPAHEIKSFRPVSLLSCISKVAESLVERRIRSWCNDHDAIPPQQSGFQPKRSTLDVITHVTQSAFDSLQRRDRSVLVAVDFKAAFDRVWKMGLLRDLAAGGLPSRCLRWLRAFLSDRYAAVRWNDTLSPFRLFQEGLPQGSPLSPLLYCIATARLPRAAFEAAPESETDQYADDFTLVASAKTPELAAEAVQPALDAVTDWASNNHVLFSMDKTEALIISLDPRETCGKAQPTLRLNHEEVSYAYNPETKKTTGPDILGVKFDSQLRFNQQTEIAVKKLKNRTKIIQALAGKDWGLRACDLRQLYKSYVRPGGLYAAGSWGCFLADSHIRRLESCNYNAARTIIGAPSGSPAAPTCSEAELIPIEQVIQEEATLLFNKYTRFPESHFLHDLTKPVATRPRLKSRGESSFRKDWRQTASRRIAEIPRGSSVRAQIIQDREDRARATYFSHTPADSWHRRCTNGQSLPVWTTRTREEEVALHRLRLNRATHLQHFRHRIGKEDSPICTNCDLQQEETAEHYLLTCPRWTKERLDCLGAVPDPSILQNAPESVVSFIRRTGMINAA